MVSTTSPWTSSSASERDLDVRHQEESTIGFMDDGPYRSITTKLTSQGKHAVVKWGVRGRIPQINILRGIPGTHTIMVVVLPPIAERPIIP